MALYETVLILVGVAVLGAVILPRLLSQRPLSFPLVYVAFGFVVFSLPLELPSPNPIEQGMMAERLTELGVIVALMGAGLEIDREFGLRRWRSTWRLLAVTMPLTIAGSALLGWWMIELTIAHAVLLGAVIAPTDPVLASDVQVERPQEGVSDEVRFALTSEAGLNDGLAFPFTYMAMAMVTVGVAPENWLVEWVLVDVFYQIIVGVIVGWLIGKLLAMYLFQAPVTTKLAAVMAGAEALAATFLSYGITEIAGGYGFIAVFVTAITIRSYEPDHEYHHELYDFAEIVERLVMSILLVLFGGAIATGLLAPLTWQGVVVALVIVFVIRPVAGIISLFDYPTERNAIAFFGIRGIGSFYYLAYAVNNAGFPGAQIIWSIVGVVVIVSIVVHGLTAVPVMRDLRREATEPEME